MVAPIYLPRTNAQIRAPELRVIDEAGKNLGVLPLEKALEEARSRGFDLIEISPAANPPVAKIMDFGKYKYEKEREARKSKAKAHKDVVKTVRITFGAGLHDLETWARKVEEFLGEGNRVQVEMRLRGREKGKQTFAYEKLQKFLRILPVEVKVLGERKTMNGFQVMISKQ
ncbi:MAG: translation initiation factor IF-3 [Parcubacteria group bacterium]|nr:translation initiation factor IF-3 [Parcubacteria group bacterium]